MFNPHKLIMPVGTVLVSAAVATQIVLPYLEHVVSPCFNDNGVMTCSVEPPDITHGPERDRPEPLRAQRALTVTASSTSVQFKAITTVTVTSSSL